jgi:hypothetical protein
MIVCIFSRLNYIVITLNLFENDESEMYKIKGQGDSAEIDYTTKITVSKCIRMVGN